MTDVAELVRLLRIYGDTLTTDAARALGLIAIACTAKLGGA